jgi:hypothetical protein
LGGFDRFVVPTIQYSGKTRPYDILITHYPVPELAEGLPITLFLSLPKEFLSLPKEFLSLPKEFLSLPKEFLSLPKDYPSPITHHPSPITH